ncbi:MAG: hypothetical protein ABIU54_12120 [Candidatus Eisenbacteria bacterium]
MNRSEATDRSHRWLEEQLATLGGLRNATSRDSSFKAWRQSTLTVLQRIWPSEPMRSEKFRRIAFTPSGSRPEPAQVRGVYSRGCVEASNYLRALITEVDANGVVEPELPAERDMSLPQGEDDFPTVELPGAHVSEQHGPDTGDNDIVLELGGASNGSPPAPQAQAHHRALPPPLQAPPIAATLHPTPVERTRSGRPSKASRRGGVKQRLKDMLGLSHLAAPTSEETSPSVPIQREEAPNGAVVQLPATAMPSAGHAPEPENGVFTTKPSMKQRNKGVVSIESLISPEFRNAPTDPAPVAPPASQESSATSEPLPGESAVDEREIDPEEFARAAEDFLKNSPVLGLVGKPVQRTKVECDLLDPDAVAIFTLATDVSRLGVPEGRRAAARALMLDLARRVEANDADWASLRGTVTFAMEFPELARRLIPILLPWLDRAA